jgi:hypothetical protein
LPDPEPSTAAVPDRTRRDRWWALLLVALVVLPLVVSAFHLWFGVGTDYLPTVDWALFELQTRDAIDHGVLVGPYSRYGWNHPGPMLFYALAVPYKLLGSRSISMHIAALAVNAAALTTIGWVAWRRGRLAMVVIVLVPVALLTRSLGADLLRDPWNPYLPVLSLLLLMLLVWSIAVDDIWMAPIAILVGSFTIQSHVGLALETVALLLVAVTAVVARGLRTTPDGRRAYWVRVGKATGVAVAVFAVLWAPVAYGTFVKNDGNLDKIFRFFTEGRESAGLTTGLEVLGLQWGPKPEWLTGARGFGVLGNAYLEPNWWAAVWLVLGVATVVLAVRRRAADTIWFAVVTAVGLVAGLIAVSNVIGIPYPYLFRWTWVLGAALGILVMQGVWLLVPTARRATVLHIAVPVAVLGLGVITVVETVDAIDAGTPYANAQDRERVITSEVLAELPPGDGPVKIDTSQGGVIAPGIALQLERRGIPVQMRPAQPVVYGTRRSDDDGPYRAELVIVLGDEEIRDFDPPGPRVAHFTRARNDEDRATIRRFEEEASRLPPGPDRDALLDVVRKSRNGPAEEVAVYLVEPGR